MGARKGGPADSLKKWRGEGKGKRTAIGRRRCIKITPSHSISPLSILIFQYFIETPAKGEP